MMTEDEAKGKWCPFARVASAPGGSLATFATVNRGGAGSRDEVSCLGSACMAWRNEFGIKVDEETGLIWADLKPTGRGYCGLAGKP